MTTFFNRLTTFWYHEFVLGNFIMNKISNDIAGSVSDENLIEFSLVYGDIPSYITECFRQIMIARS